MEVRFIQTNMGPEPVAAYTEYFKRQYPQAQYFCVHKTLGYRRKWSITHVPTGLGFGKLYRTRYAATRALGKILEMQRDYGKGGKLHWTMYAGDDFSGNFVDSSWWNNAKVFYKRIVEENGGL